MGFEVHQKRKWWMMMLVLFIGCVTNSYKMGRDCILHSVDCFEVVNQICATKLTSTSSASVWGFHPLEVHDLPTVAPMGNHALQLQIPRLLIKSSSLCYLLRTSATNSSHPNPIWLKIKKNAKLIQPTTEIVVILRPSILWSPWVFAKMPKDLHRGGAVLSLETTQDLADAWMSVNVCFISGSFLDKLVQLDSWSFWMIFAMA